MMFLDAILEHFGLHFGTKNGQKRNQNTSMKKVKKIKPFLTWEREARFVWKLLHVRVYQ